MSVEGSKKMAPERLLQDVVENFARAGKVQALLMRVEHPDSDPAPTGVSAVFGESEDGLYLELSGLNGELPATLRILKSGAISTVQARSDEEPSGWDDLDNEDDDVRALLVFSLLDPRLVVANMDHDRVEYTYANHGKWTSASVHVHLDNWEPKLPEKFVKWLHYDAFDRVITLDIENDRLVRTVQADLPPWRADMIITEYIYDS